MKKIIVLLVLIFAVSSMSFAGTWAVGGAFSFGLGGDAGISPGEGIFLLRTPFVPLMFGIAFSIGNNAGAVIISADYWFYHKALGGTLLSFYVGIGAYVGIAGSGDNTNISIGGRLPIGLQIFPIKPMEIFLEFAPGVGVAGLGGDAISFPDWRFGLAIGLRFWIK